MDIFQYTDFCEWLNQSLIELKRQKPFASIRYIGQKSGIDPGNLVRIKQGQVHPGKKALGKLSKLFDLDAKQTFYMEEMIKLSKAKNDKEAWASYQKLHALKGADVKTLADHEFEFFSKWYHVVVRSLLNVVNFNKNYSTLGKMLVPPISSIEAKASINLLKKLNMIERNDKGYWKAKEQFVGSGSKWKGQIIKNYQSQVLKQASTVFDEIKAPLLDVSTVTLNIPRNSVPDFKAYLKEVRNGIMGMAKSYEKDDAVYQLNISLFPTALPDLESEK